MTHFSFGNFEAMVGTCFKVGGRRSMSKGRPLDSKMLKLYSLKLKGSCKYLAESVVLSGLKSFEN